MFILKHSKHRKTRSKVYKVAKTYVRQFRNFGTLFELFANNITQKHSPVSGPKHNFALPKHVTNHSPGVAYECWDTLPHEQINKNGSSPPPRKSSRTKQKSHGDEDGDIPMEEVKEKENKENTKDDDSDAGDFDEHVRSGEGFNRRMKKIGLTWWRINKKQTKSNVDCEPKLDIHHLPFVKHLRNTFREGEEDNWEKERDWPVVVAMLDVFRSCEFRNHLPQILFDEMERVCRTGEITKLRNEVFYHTRTHAVRH